MGDALAHHYRRGCEVVACKRGQCFIGEWALDGRGVENGGGACAGDADQVHTRRNRVQVGRAGATRACILTLYHNTNILC